MRVGAARPQQPRQRDAERREQREAGGQADDGKGQQPAERLGIDQKRMADPVKAGEEIAEAEPPAGDGRGGHAAAPRPAAEPSISQTSDRKSENSSGQN